MNKSKAKKRKVKKIKKVKLTPDTIVKIVVPPGHVPSVITDPIDKALVVLPLPVAKLKDKTWREWLFG